MLGSSDDSDAPGSYCHVGSGRAANAGDALFAAFAGGGYQPREHVRPGRDRGPQCSMSELLGEALRLCGKSGGETSSTTSSANSQARRRRRPELTLTQMKALGERYLMEYDAARVARMRGWAMAWVARECSEYCTTLEERSRFLRCVRRWARKAKEGGFEAVHASTLEGHIVEMRAATGHDAAISHGSSANSHGIRACTASLPPSKRRRTIGAGGLGTMKMPEISSELFNWFVDTIQNIKGRLPSCLLLVQSQIIVDDLASLHQQRIEAGEVPPHSTLDFPVLDFKWLRRWRLRWGVSWRLTNLRFKAPRSVVKQRLLVFWKNVLRVRFLHAATEPGGELVFEGIDQKPLWFTASSQERGLALRGARKVATKENVPATRARFTAMTRCRWPTPPSDGKDLAILFKASGSGVRIRETLRVPPSVLLQFQEKGSYRLADCATYLAWILDRSRLRGPAASGHEGGADAASSQEGDAGAALVDDARPAEDTAVLEDAERPTEDHAVLVDGARPKDDSEDGAQAATSHGGGDGPFGRRVVYLLDWYAPHLDPSLDAMVHEAGHTILRIGGHLTGLVAVNDTHAHGPMTAVYKKRETLEAFEQLQLRPDRLPSTSRQTVMDRALDSWQAISHGSCSRGFVSNGIANKLDGSEDALLSLEVQEFWQELDMPRWREVIRDEVRAAISHGTVTGFADVQSLLEPYPAHGPMEEGQEAFATQVAENGDVEDCGDATDPDADDNMGDDDDGDDGAPPPPPPPRPPLPPPDDLPPPDEDRMDDADHGQGGDHGHGEGRGGHEGPDGGPGHGAAAASRDAAANSHDGQCAVGAQDEFMDAAVRHVDASLGRQRETVNAALQAVLSGGGDQALADSLRGRLRAVDKRLAAANTPVALRLRAKAAERQAAVAKARVESIAEETRLKALKLEVDLTKASAELAKAKGKEAAAAANAALAEAKEKRAEAQRLKAKADAEDHLCATQFAACLAARLEEYLPSGAAGEERRARCRRIAFAQARARAGKNPIPIPRFWTQSVANMRRVTARGVGTRLRTKDEVMYASADFCWSLTKRRSTGSFDCCHEPRFMLHQLIERTLPGYFHVLGCRYNLDNLLAESRHIMDLAYVAAAWRYTHVLGGLKYFRCGLMAWPCMEEWWTSRAATSHGAAATAGAAGASDAAVVAGAAATSHAEGGTGPVVGYTSV